MTRAARRSAVRCGGVAAITRAAAPALLAAAAAGTLLLAVPVDAAPGVSADPTSDIRVTVTGLSPAGLGVGDTLHITARVVNASGVTLTDVGARLWLDTSPLTSRQAVHDYLASAANLEIGQVVLPSVVDVAPELGPGQSAQVDISVPVDQLALPPTFGVHGLTLDLRVAQPDGSRRTAGVVRTVVVDTAGTVPVVRVAWIWPLVDTPARGPDGVIPAAAARLLSEQLQPTGRLGTLLATAEGRAVSILVDAGLLEDVRALATGRGLAADVPPDPTAEAWLRDLATEVTRPGSDIRVLPYADPDLTAVVRAGLGGDLTIARDRAAAVAADILGRPLEPAPAWPAGGRINRPTLRTLSTQHADTVILASDDLEPVTEFPGTPDAVAALDTKPGATVVTSDSGLATLLDTGPTGSGGLALARQRLLAETAMIAAERPSDPRSVLAAPTRAWDVGSRWAVSVAGLEAPWIDRVTLRALETNPGDAPGRTLARYGDAAVAAEVPAAQLASVQRFQDQLREFGQAVSDPAALDLRFSSPLLTAQSAAWRGDGARAGASYTADLGRQVHDTVNSVRLLPRGQVTLSSRTSIVPLAVQNAFDQDVRVRVQLTSTPTVRLSSDSSEVFVIPAGRTASVDVPAEATTDATFPVVARLLTPDGQPFGQPVSFTLRATGYGQVARIVVGGALLVLAVAVVLRVARRIRAGAPAPGGTLDP